MVVGPVEVNTLTEELSQPGAPVETPPATPTESADDQAQPDEGKPAEPPKPSRAQERITQLIAERDAEREARAKAETELQELRQPTPAPKEPAPSKHPLADHPALKGLTVDADGDVELGPGRYIPANVLVEQYETQQRLDALEKRYQADQDATKKAEADAKEAELQQALAESVESRIGEIREDTLPKLSTKHAAAVDKVVLLLVQGPLNDAYHAGKFTPEFAEKTLRAAFTEARTLFGVFGAQQFQDNLKYEQTHKAAKPGAPGEKVVSLNKMTPEQSKADAINRAARIERELRSG